MMLEPMKEHPPIRETLKPPGEPQGEKRKMPPKLPQK